MARTQATVTEVTSSSAAEVASAYTTIDATLVTNGLSVTDAFDKKYDCILVHVKNTAGAEKDLTVRAGGSVYSRAALGDMTVAVSATSGEKMITIETARFAQSDQTLSFDFETGMTGSIALFGVKNS